jgi:hypothetical protein
VGKALLPFVLFSTQIVSMLGYAVRYAFLLPHILLSQKLEICQGEENCFLMQLYGHFLLVFCHKKRLLATYCSRRKYDVFCCRFLLDEVVFCLLFCRYYLFVLHLELSRRTFSVRSCCEYSLMALRLRSNDNTLRKLF